MNTGKHTKYAYSIQISTFVLSSLKPQFYLYILSNSVKSSLYRIYHLPTRTINRLTEEASLMRLLHQTASDETKPDRATLSRSIVAWDDSIKSLRDRKRIFLVGGSELDGCLRCIFVLFFVLVCMKMIRSSSSSGKESCIVNYQ